MLAGGHSLLPLMKLRLAAPALLVDLRRVPGLTRDPARGRHGADRRDDAHHDRGGGGGLGLASTAASTIADQQVRNRGTLGGSLAHGDPASDMPAVLLACEGSVTIRGAAGQREVAAADLFEDFLTTAVGDGEILTEVRLPTHGRLRVRLPEVQPPPRGLGDGRRLRAGQEGGRRLVRGRADRAHPHGLDAAAGDRRRAGAARRGRSTPTRSPRPPSRRPRAPSRPPTSTPRRTTSATWRGCSAGGRSSRRHQ